MTQRDHIEGLYRPEQAKESCGFGLIAHQHGEPSHELVRAAADDEFAFQTTNAKVFAAGDMVRGADLVVTAVADGRKAAVGIVRYLGCGDGKYYDASD